MKNSAVDTLCLKIPLRLDRHKSISEVSRMTEMCESDAAGPDEERIDCAGQRLVLS